MFISAVKLGQTVLALFLLANVSALEVCCFLATVRVIVADFTPLVLHVLNKQDIIWRLVRLTVDGNWILSQIWSEPG